MNATLILFSALLFAVIFFALMWNDTHAKLKKTLKKIEELEKGIEEERDARAREAIEAAGRLDEMREKYSSIISQEEEIVRLRNEADGLAQQVSHTRIAYSEKRKLLDQLREQVAIFDERIAFAELGIYEPHFNYNDSEDFKAKIVEVRGRQKSLVSANMAVLCPTDWTVEGSKSKGKTMVNRQTRLTLRAFNNECDAAIANARWNNVVAMEKRILNAEKAINKENSSLNIIINDAYVSLKIEELRLTHEYRERLKSEKEERAELARAEREEKRLIAEAEAAEREEVKYQQLVEKARREIVGNSVSDAMREKIEELEAALKSAHDRSLRARAMAEMTQSGYVYIISNVGSFGEDVLKIGLTRRLDPDDRIRELGDASVPFGFDVHAMIYSDEAPALEASLHREFADRRINMANTRKEFFRVTLHEIEEAVFRLAPDASFFKDREAQEWHETLAKRRQNLEEMQGVSSDLPDEI